MAVSSLNILSLCSGYGGLDLGIGLAEPSARTRCYVEREVTAAAILAARMEDGILDAAPIWSDLRTFDGRPWRGAIDVLTGGYPCQPFSYAGARLGEADPRHLWPDFARLIGESAPEFVFLENVAGHLTLGFRSVHDDLGRLGYRVAAGLFTAEEVGAPHRRQRLFILAHRSRSTSAATGSQLVYAGRRNGRARRAESAVSEIAGPREPVTRPSDILADASRERLQERSYRAGSRNEMRGRSRLAIFPPRPQDAAAWNEQLRDWPDTEPAICRAANGSTSRLDVDELPRTDRFRALGNGVCPLSAALAWRTLRDALEENRSLN